jgi:hypothetical protein
MKDKRLQSTSRRQFHRMALLAVSSLGLLGCATTTTPSSSAVTTQDPLARPLPLTFKTPELRQQLESVGLLASFTTYWNHYAQRRWSERYEMEILKNNLSREVYESYYKPAGIIKAFQINAVDRDEKGRVRVQVQAEFENRDDPRKTHSFLLQDWWEASEANEWKHLNHDPFLNSARTSP